MATKRPPARAPKPKPASEPQAGNTARLVLYAVAALGFIALAVVFWLSTRSSAVDPAAAAQARTTLEAAGCTLRLVKASANASDHTQIQTPDMVSDEWQTDPPTTGPHYGETAIYGAYTDQLEQARVIHNLEHGAVAIQYGPKVSQATVASLRGFYDRHPNGTLLAPYAPLGERVALGAWIAEGGGKGQGVLALCPGFDEVAYAAFLDAYQFKGPEKFSPDSMAPGNR